MSFYGSQTHDGDYSEHLIASLDKPCFNYLWQKLMSRADVSVMAVVLNLAQ